MASLEGLSDGEIRVKLTELGYPVGPITATTRKVLLKKLKYLLDQSKFPSRDSKDGKKLPSLSKFSSEEDSEDDFAASNRNRQSMPPPKSTQKTVKRRSSSRRSQETDINNFTENTIASEFSYPSASSTLNLDTNIGIGTQNHRYSPKNIKSTNHIVSTEDRNDGNHFGISQFNSSSIQSKFTHRQSTEPYDTGSDTDGIDEIESKVLPLRTRSPVYSSFVPSLNTGLSQARSRFQPQLLGSTTDSSTSRFSPRHQDSGRNSSSQPFSSDFVRRLSASSSIKSGSGAGLPSRLLDVKESDDEEASSTPTYTHQNTGNYRRGTAVSWEEKIWKNSTTISMVVLFLVALFFCGLGIVYLNVRFKETPISSSDANFPICKMKGKAGVDCILDAEVQPTMSLFREIYQILNERAIQHACGGDIDSAALSQDQITQQLVHKLEKSVWFIESNFGNIRVLINANPQWGVDITDNKLSIPSPNLPLGCYILSFFYGVIGSALRIVIVLGALVLIGKGVYWWIDRKERSEKEMFKMVENIIDILSSHQHSTQQNNADNHYLAISHVRDQLIPPHQRDKMAKIWNKAVSYLEENDSRVRTEVQQVLGEEFRVWRWLPAPRSNGKRKVWQGQAFGTMEGSVNSLPISPTPCLKIRQMFDSIVEDGEDWTVRVQDAILEKCEGANVLHVAVDKNSNEGCVYVKCASPQDAGRAYRALHGSWFDSKLVTVKYLRLERYHERFPEAIRCVRPLRPSNDHKLSLQ